MNQHHTTGMRPCADHVKHSVVQVDPAAANRAAVQRRAQPGTEAAALPGGSPIFAAAADEGNKVLHEAMPPLQVGPPLLIPRCMAHV